MFLAEGDSYTIACDASHLLKLDDALEKVLLQRVKSFGTYHSKFQRFTTDEMALLLSWESKCSNTCRRIPCLGTGSCVAPVIQLSQLSQTSRGPGYAFSSYPPLSGQEHVRNWEWITRSMGPGIYFRLPVGTHRRTLTALHPTLKDKCHRDRTNISRGT